MNLAEILPPGISPTHHQKEDLLVMERSLLVTKWLLQKLNLSTVFHCIKERTSKKSIVDHPQLTTRSRWKCIVDEGSRMKDGRRKRVILDGEAS